MSYPNRSDGWSSLPDSLWWKFRDQSTGIVSICSSQVRTVLVQLQRNMVADLPFAFTVDGTAFVRSQIAVDGNFGPRSFAGLRRMLEDRDVPQSIQDTVLADYTRLAAGGTVQRGASNQPLTLATCACILWMAAHRNLPWSSMLIPSDLVAIRFDAPAPLDGAAGGLITCVDEREIGTAPGAPPSSLGTPPSTTVGEQPEASGDDTATGLAIAAAAALVAFGITGKGRRSPF